MMSKLGAAACGPLLIIALLCTFAPPPVLGAGEEVRLMAIRDAMGRQDWKAALVAVREEIAAPATREPAHLMNLRLIAIGILGDHVRQFGATAQETGDADRFFAEALAYAANSPLQRAQVRKVYTLYCTKIGRPGRALQLAREDLDYWLGTENTYQQISAYDTLATIYQDAGQLVPARHFREQALAQAGNYFRVGERPSDPGRWLGYGKLLEKHLDDIAKPGSADQVARVWTLYERISAVYFGSQTLSYLLGAESFARAGDILRARQLTDRARTAWASEKSRLSGEMAQQIELDLQSRSAAVEYYAGDDRKAIAGFLALFETAARFGWKSGLPSQHRLLGEAYERMGESEKAAESYGVAVREYEGGRESFSVAERAAFFRSAVRLPYWGLIRVLAREHARSGQAAVFDQALAASERVRGRQLGDLIQEGVDFTPQRANQFRAALDADEAVLAYTLMDKEIVILAFTRNRQLSIVIPYDGPAFRRQVLDLAKDLSDSDSDAVALQRRLADLSRVLLAPVTELLAHGKRIVVLPDGVINALPFDLLSLDQGSYRPLLADRIVRLAPSLRVLQRGASRHSVAGGRFLGIADPIYTKSPQAPGLTQEDMKALSRGNRYLAYFTPLPETRREVQAAGKLVGSGEPRLLVGSEARESRVKRLDLRPYRYLHFATHGIIGGEVPGVDEAALVLGEEREEDGLLMASEVAELKLDAELVVLSACKTGAGEYFTGEGVMGMSRSFLAAGGRSTVVSLWSVDSLATERLMVAFYRYLKQGLNRPEALRAAKLEVSGGAGSQGKSGTNSEYSHPFFWAAFQIYGS
ncbi:CHAT domain-containing protein [Accumulibacter sp.]|uniref:CHAT domain-containing protein n=1 Tax=Accumulibacter sp. TaxID=2053492 RepID=UPI00262510F1|nr:CHAT domain-containing protein [Accumulibacter sp.]